MLKLLKSLTLFFLFTILLGCSLIKQFDSSNVDNRVIYKQSQPLPPLKISPELDGKPR
ncbi:MAG: hypothetical protein KAH84_01195 [Thiomargarita sp.]|nr:hypothetical protein [Thiomargarita sp.]